MRLALAFALLAASPVVADEPAEEAVLEFMGGQGCTFGPDSIAAAQAAGFEAAHLDTVRKGALADGTATQLGEWVVLNASVCTIRLPLIETEWELDNPRIQALITAVDEMPDEPGCFLEGAPQFFSDNYGDPVRAHDAYMSFLAAHVISGDLRFYSPSGLVTPVSFQVMTGACGAVPAAEEIHATHRYIADAPFATYLAYLQEADSCFEEGAVGGFAAALAVQGLSPGTYQAAEGTVFNAWLQIEYTVITAAAGWRIGASMESPGMTRPPLCMWPPAG